MEEKFSALDAIYSSFEEQIREYIADRACSKGCGFCCTHAGSIDITTLEGLRIISTIKKFSKARKKSLEKILYREVKQREKDKIVSCPFLMKNNACMIYNIRPFSCRRIYSLHVCTAQNPPQVSRTVIDIAKEHIQKLQKLDDTGYSGHISYILHMLETPAFLTTYLGGRFKPEEIVVFGKSHKIIINKMMI